MSTKQTTSGSNTQNTAFKFDPQSLTAYHQNLSQFLPFLQSQFQNPYGSQMFQQESAIGQDQAGRTGQRNISNITNNINALGGGTSGGAISEMISNASRATGGQQANAFRSAVLNANQRSMQSAGIASAFQPLFTGSNSQGTFNQTQQTSGLGTWLPQLAGAGLGAGIGALTGGAGGSKGFSGSLSAAGSGVGSTGAGMGGMFSGIGNVMSGSGYGYGSNGFNSQGGFLNPFMFGGR